MTARLGLSLETEGFDAIEMPSRRPNRLQMRLRGAGAHIGKARCPLRIVIHFSSAISSIEKRPQCGLAKGADESG